MEQRDRQAACPAGYRDAPCEACRTALYVPVGQGGDVLCDACRAAGDAAAAEEEDDDPRPPASGAMHPDFPRFVALAARTRATGASWFVRSDLSADVLAVSERLASDLLASDRLAVGWLTTVTSGAISAICFLTRRPSTGRSSAMRKNCSSSETPTALLQQYRASFETHLGRSRPYAR